VNVLKEGESDYSGRKLGLLLLKDGEAARIATDRDIFSKESFDTSLSSKNIEKFIGQLTQRGFFKHLTTDELKKARNEAVTTDINSLNDLLMRFPKTVVDFDWEAVNLENPYEELTKRFSAASRGAFKVTGITDGYRMALDKGLKKVDYGFNCNGKRYKANLEMNSDWLSPAFLEVIRNALKENCDGDIYQCYFDGQGGGYIYLEPSHHKFIVDNYPDLLRDKNLD
jgi:hypothetical protein